MIADNYSLSKVIPKSLQDEHPKSALQWHIVWISSNSSETVLRRLTFKICVHDNKVAVLIQLWIVVLQYAGIMHSETKTLDSKMSLYLCFCHFKSYLFVPFISWWFKGFLHFIIQWVGLKSHYRAGICCLRKRWF